jgi:predicted permease
MKGLTSIVRRLRAMLTRNTRDHELEEEIRLHLDLRAQSLIDRGVDASDAAAGARRQFGNVLAKREDARDTWSVRAIDEVLQNLRFGLRLLRRSPAFTIVAVLSLGIGMGASAAVFSLADALLFKKLPVRAPDELATFQWSSGPKPPTTSLTGNMISNVEGFVSTSFSVPGFNELRRTAAGSADLFAFGTFWGGLNFSSDGRPDVVSAQVVSGNYFNVLGLVPAAGRLIGEGDDRPDAPPVAVISYLFWQRRFGLSPSAIGKAITVNNMPATIIGVSPKGFHGTLEAGDSPAVTLPIARRSAIEHDPGWNSTHLWWLVIMGRFHSGRAPADALPELDGAFKQIAATANPELTAADLPRLRLLPGAHGQTDARESRTEVLTIMALVAGVLLLVASANVASLLLVRGTARSREVAMRVAIGASRARVVRQFLTEAMMLSAFGSAVGVVISEWIARGLVAALAAGAGDVMELAINTRLLAFAAGLGALCCVLFGLVPALRATRAMSNKGVLTHVDGRSAVGSDRRATLVSGLVLVQVALSVLLASLGGLLSYSVWSLQRVSPGFDASNVLIFTVYPLRNGYEVPRIRTTYQAAIARLEALPGVRSATFSASPLIGSGGSTTVALPLDTPVVPRNSDEYRRLERANVAWRLIVGDRFFETMGIPLLRGRAFTPADATGASIPGVVVNRSLAQKLFKDEAVVGRRFKTGVAADAPVVEIIGVVADAKYAYLRRDAPPTIYGSYRQHRVTNVTFEVKATGDPLALASLVTGAMNAVDPNLPLASMRTQAQQIERSMTRERLMARLAIVLGGLSALLSAIGLYGLLAYAVTRRVPEIGVRMALGAARGSVLWLFLRHALIVATAGAIIGLGAAYAATGLVQALLFGVSPTDPLILAAAALINFAVALLAAYLPARRAARIDPVVALRAE